MNNIVLTQEQLKKIIAALKHKRSCAYKYITQDPQECTCGVTIALATIRAAKAQEQAEQEPFGYHFTDDPKVFAMPGSGFRVGKEPPPDCLHAIPLYAAPVRVQDLTDEEVMQTYINFNVNELGEQSFMLAFARAVIAADRRKNK